jgi:hypothetical protein
VVMVGKRSVAMTILVMGWCPTVANLVRHSVLKNVDLGEATLQVTALPLVVIRLAGQSSRPRLQEFSPVARVANVLQHVAGSQHGRLSTCYFERGMCGRTNSSLVDASHVAQPST